MLTQKRLKELLTYDPLTGIFTRVKPLHRNGVLEAFAGRVNENGYIQISVDCVRYYAHRLAWLWMTGKWPQHTVDHRNRKRQDNRWKNLRDLTLSENRQNSKLPKNNKTGVCGVCLAAGRRKYTVFASINGAQKWIGNFKTIKEATKARRAVERAHHRYAPAVRRAA